jgi:hypothetical protein
MPSHFANINSLFRNTTLALIALSFFLVAAQAQTRGERNEIIVNGQTVPVGLIQGETLRFTAFNPSETDSGQPNEPISLQMKLCDSHGAVIAVSPKVMIPPGEFRSVDFNRDDLPISGEPGTTRAQLRTIPLWGIRSRSRDIRVPTSLEIFSNNTTSAGTFRFFYNVEALP